MACANKWQLDPKLEKQRNNVPIHPKIDKDMEGLTKLAKIDVAHLYYSEEGHYLLQELCQWLSGTKSSNIYAGWETFGIKLGLEPLLISCIKNNFHSEDPTTYVIAAYAQQKNATIEKILKTLYEIGRHDILLQIKDRVEKLCHTISAKQNLNDRLSTIAKKPLALPNVPFIFKNLDTASESCNPKQIEFATKELHTSIPSTPSSAEYKTKPYTKSVLLTFTQDAEEIAQDCIFQMRKLRGTKRLGVVVLKEELHKLTTSPDKFILDCFVQVDYIFPIITHQYINQVTGKEELNLTSVFENADHKYVKYIYSLMNNFFLKNGCVNKKVRCIIPDNIIHSVLRHPMIMADPLFEIWVSTSRINEMINAILNLN